MVEICQKFYNPGGKKGSGDQNKSHDETSEIESDRIGEKFERSLGNVLVLLGQEKRKRNWKGWKSWIRY